ncbi:hypothetical protein FKG94_23805 [Exilibacterium tricleocarpae]|uniref:Uncharacterized protein n=1 Tax=Exilibacterium tricleocarpae TaxID=2591008 RepID=A0A545ST35_9GAMM|nr:hypothetical protein [Exilibacterium tricleocarpae]TQV68119.1 hypothetical protein FKG94_23805 [Exilibacterium tricleocarpae]
MLFFLAKYVDKRLPVVKTLASDIRLELSGNQFTLKIPASNSENRDSQSAIQRSIDLFNAANWGGSASIELFSRSWKYHQGFNLLDKGYGDLLLSIQVRKCEAGASNMFNYQQLAQEITSQYDKRYACENQKADATAVVSSHIPIDEFYGYPNSLNRFYRRDINSLPWLLHNVVGKETHTVYSLPITDRYFLWVDFHYQPFKFRGAWELCETAGAENDVKAIIETFKFSYAVPPEKGILNLKSISSK